MFKKNSIPPTIILLISLGVAPRLYSETIRLGTWEIPGWVENETSGAKISIIGEIQRKTGLEIEIAIFPVKRTLMLFETNVLMGYFPALDSNIPKEVAKTDFYTQKSLFLVHKRGTVISDIDDLYGKRIGLVTGYSYPDSLVQDPGLDINYSNNPELIMRQLIARRMDVFIETEATILKLIEELDCGDELTISSEPFYSLDAYIAFQPTEDGGKYAESFSQALREMKEDGTLDSILSSVKSR